MFLKISEMFIIPEWVEVAQFDEWLAMGWMNGVWFPEEARTFHFATMLWSTFRLNISTLQWISEDFSVGVKVAGAWSRPVTSIWWQDLEIYMPLLCGTGCMDSFTCTILISLNSWWSLPRIRCRLKLESESVLDIDTNIMLCCMEVVF